MRNPDRQGLRGPAPRPIRERIEERTVLRPSGGVEWTGCTRNGYGCIGVGSRRSGEHLFLGTPLANTRDMDRKGRRIITPQEGSSNGRALVSRREVEEIRRAYAGGESQSSIARRYPISRTTVGYIVRFDTWREAA